MSEKNKTKLFLSYGRRDATGLAFRLRADLEKLGYEVWQDTREIWAGREWEEQIADGLRSTQVVIALLSSHAVRRAVDQQSPNNVDSVRLDELTFARFDAPPTPIIPVMAIPCEQPFPVFRLDFVSMTQWCILRTSINEALAHQIGRDDDPETLRPSTFVMSLDSIIARCRETAGRASQSD